MTQQQHPAPRYAKPVPRSNYPRLCSPQPRHRPLFRRVVGALAEAWQRELEDHAFLIGAAYGLVLVAAGTVAILARS